MNEIFLFSLEESEEINSFKISSHTLLITRRS